MVKRIVSSVVLFPIMAILVVIGGMPLKILMMVISITGMFEIYRALNKKQTPLNYISYAFIIAYYFFIENISSEFLILLVSTYIVSNMVYLVATHLKTTPIDCAVNILGFFYVGFLMSAIYLTRCHTYGKYFVWLIFISAWGCDTGAYFTGVLFGKHKLAPILSPKKTVEGAVGGIVGAILIALIYGLVVSKFTTVNDEIRIIFLFVVVSGCGAVFAQLGDLTASAIKRYTGIKDYGKLIPGHGGILDRFDSILFTAPAVYAVMCFLLRRY